MPKSRASNQGGDPGKSDQHNAGPSLDPLRRIGREVIGILALTTLPVLQPNRSAAQSGDGVQSPAEDTSARPVVAEEAQSASLGWQNRIPRLGRLEWCRAELERSADWDSIRFGNAIDLLLKGSGPEDYALRQEAEVRMKDVRPQFYDDPSGSWHHAEGLRLGARQYGTVEESMALPYIEEAIQRDPTNCDILALYLDIKLENAMQNGDAVMPTEFWGRAQLLLENLLDPEWQPSPAEEKLKQRALRHAIAVMVHGHRLSSVFSSAHESGVNPDSVRVSSEAGLQLVELAKEQKVYDANLALLELILRVRIGDFDGAKAAYKNGSNNLSSRIMDVLSIPPKFESLSEIRKVGTRFTKEEREAAYERVWLSLYSPREALIERLTYAASMAELAYLLVGPTGLAGLNGKEGQSRLDQISGVLVLAGIWPSVEKVDRTPAIGMWGLGMAHTDAQRYDEGSGRNMPTLTLQVYDPKEGRFVVVCQTPAPVEMPWGVSDPRVLDDLVFNPNLPPNIRPMDLVHVKVSPHEQGELALLGVDGIGFSVVLAEFQLPSRWREEAIEIRARLLNEAEGKTESGLSLAVTITNSHQREVLSLGGAKIKAENITDSGAIQFSWVAPPLPSGEYFVSLEVEADSGIRHGRASVTLGDVKLDPDQTEVQVFMQKPNSFRPMPDTVPLLSETPGRWTAEQVAGCRDNAQYWNSGSAWGAPFLPEFDKTYIVDGNSEITISPVAAVLSRDPTLEDRGMMVNFIFLPEKTLQTWQEQFGTLTPEKFSGFARGLGLSSSVGGVVSRPGAKAVRLNNEHRHSVGNGSFYPFKLVKIPVPDLTIPNWSLVAACFNSRGDIIAIDIEGIKIRTQRDQTEGDQTQSDQTTSHPAAK